MDARRLASAGWHSSHANGSVSVSIAQSCEAHMEWYVYVARFFAGAFLTNAVPHFVSGLQGRPFPTPFASPPGKGESSSQLNVIWGAANAIIGYLLLFRVGVFSAHSLRQILIVGVGGLIMALRLATHFGGLYGGTSPARR